VYGKVAEVMQWRADLLTAERFDDLAREYLLPLALYQGDRQVVLNDHEEVAGLFAQLRASHRSRGIVRLQAEVTAVDLPRHGRFRVWLRYFDLDAQGQVLSQTDVVHYCRDTPEGLKTEMAEYGRCALPDLWTTSRSAPAHLA
jgi:hypothetical protein